MKIVNVNFEKSGNLKKDNFEISQFLKEIEFLEFLKIVTVIVNFEIQNEISPKMETYIYRRQVPDQLCHWTQQHWN